MKYTYRQDTVFTPKQCLYQKEATGMKSLNIRGFIYMPSLLKSDANGRVATQVCSRVISRWHRCEPALPESAVVARNIWQEYLSCPISGIQKPEQVYGSHGLEEWDKANWHLSGLGNQLSLSELWVNCQISFFFSLWLWDLIWEWPGSEAFLCKGLHKSLNAQGTKGNSEHPTNVMKIKFKLC